MMFGSKTVEEFVALHPWKGTIFVDFVGLHTWRAMYVPSHAHEKKDLENAPVAHGPSAQQAFQNLMTVQVNEKGELCESF